MKNRTKILFSAPVALILLMFFIVAVPLPSLAACPQGENQIQFLHYNSGIDSVINGSTLDSYNFTANQLQTGDIIQVIASRNTGGLPAADLTLAHVESGLATLTSPLVTIATPIGIAYITNRGTSNTLMNGIGNLDVAGRALTATSFPWTNAWTLALRDGTSSAGTNHSWNWTIYKINRTGNCAVASSGGDGGATSSASDTEAFANIDAEQRTMVYVAILALALAAFNSAAFWAWRIVKGTKKEL